MGLLWGENARVNGAPLLAERSRAQLELAMSIIEPWPVWREESAQAFQERRLPTAFLRSLTNVTTQDRAGKCTVQAGPAGCIVEPKTARPAHGISRSVCRVWAATAVALKGSAKVVPW